MTTPTNPQTPQDDKPASDTTSGSDLLNWAVEQIDVIREGKLDTEGIKNMVSEAGNKIASFFGRS